MAQLTVHYRGKLIGQFDLVNKATLGRRKSNDIHLEDDTVSGHHAVVEKRKDYYCIEDLGSTNGTILGDRRIRRVGLRDGDEIGIGHYSIRFHGPSAPPSFQDTMILKLDELASAGVSQEDMKAAIGDQENALNGKTARKERIEVLSGRNAGETLFLEEAVTTIGVAGKQLAVVSRRRTGCYLIPLTGGAPRVNGRETGPDSTRLSDGDEMEVAGVRLAFRK